ncbi:putative armadillo-like helical protein [Helianthus annuus]|nr:putative armadillo-like helical protein [Helianthus annuus]
MDTSRTFKTIYRLPAFSFTGFERSQTLDFFNKSRWEGKRRIYVKSRKGGKLAIDIDTDADIQECTSASAQSGSKSLNHLLEQLYEKKGSTRESALSSIIQRSSLGYQYQFCEKNFAELLYQCLKSFKRGSSKESCLAVEALGLLAINIGCGENSRELYKESAPVLSEALKTESQSKKLKLMLDCLAIVTFVGGNELDETERSMQSIWDFMHSRTDSKESQSAAVFSWSFLLSTMDSWSISYKHWQGAIPFFKNLLEVDHESTLVGAKQALALILELGCHEKFEGDTSATEEINVKNILKDGRVPEISVKVGKQTLKVDTLPQQIQLNFLKRLLGSGFVVHMKENELLHDVFKFKPEKRQSGRELYVAERDEAAIKLFVPDVRREDSYQRIHKSQNSIFVKARTQIRNKNRDIKGEEQWCSED